MPMNTPRTNHIARGNASTACGSQRQCLADTRLRDKNRPAAPAGGTGQDAAHSRPPPHAVDGAQRRRRRARRAELRVRARRRRHGAQMVHGMVHVYWWRVCVLRVARHHLIEVGAHLTAALVTHRRVTGARHHHQNNNNCGARLKVVVARRRGAYGTTGPPALDPRRVCSQLVYRLPGVFVGGCGGVVFVVGAAAQLRCCTRFRRLGTAVYTPVGLAAAGTGKSGLPTRCYTGVFMYVCGALPGLA